MTALKILTIMKHILAGRKKKQDKKIPFKKQNGRIAVTPRLPLMSHWKGGMCQLSFVTAHLWFKHCNRPPHPPHSSPRGIKIGVLLFLESAEYQSWKKGKQKQLQSHCQTLLSGCFEIIQSVFLAAFISSNNRSSQKDVTCFMSWRTSTDSVLPAHPSPSHLHPSSLSDNQSAALAQPASSFMDLLLLMQRAK